jgi:molybdate transport system regulatory protein
MELIVRGIFEVETTDGFKIPSKVIDLLIEIEQTGSLNAAVKNLGMSYSYAWNLIYKTNCQLEHPLIISRKGGNGGGIAELTEAGKLLLKQYRKLETDFYKFLGEHKLTIDMVSQINDSK